MNRTRIWVVMLCGLLVAVWSANALSGWLSRRERANEHEPASWLHAVANWDASTGGDGSDRYCTVRYEFNPAWQSQLDISNQRLVCWLVQTDRQHAGQGGNVGRTLARSQLPTGASGSITMRRYVTDGRVSFDVFVEPDAAGIKEQFTVSPEGLQGIGSVGCPGDFGPIDPNREYTLIQYDQGNDRIFEVKLMFLGCYMPPGSRQQCIAAAAQPQ